MLMMILSIWVQCSFTAHFLLNKINLDKVVFSLHGSNQFKQNLVPFVS